MCSLMKIIIFFTFVINYSYADEQDQRELASMVKLWADNLGKELQYIAESVTRRSKVIDSFKQTKVVFEKGNKIMEDIADRLRTMMADKERAIKRIVERAEYLSYYRKSPIFENSTFDYFNADNITNSTSDPEIEEQQFEDRLEQLHQFKCDDSLNQHLDGTKPMHVPPQQLLFGEDDVRDCKVRPYIERKPGYYRHLPLVYHSNFNEEVNFNYSVMRIVTSVYDREDPVLNDIRWSEALDLVFQENFQEDPTLIWQYFAGRTGFLRHYPAIKWSDEQYERTFDFRTRAWYLEAISSPKDVIILLDMSGSMGMFKWFIAKFLVNNILDTLGDNDYVNIYLFNNEIRPLVDCFNFTLMQAHEENLRLLRESLNKYTPDTTGNMKGAFTLAFATLQHFRKDEAKSHCNQMIMFVAEGIDYDYSPAELFETRNRTEFYTPVRVFTFLIGTSPSDEVEMVWIACANMGYYVNVSIDSEIAEKVVKYLTVLSRPLNMNAVIKPDPIWTGAYADLADRRITNWLWQKYEGNQQRQAFVDYTRDAYKQYGCFFDQANMHFLQETSHEYDIYLNKNVFNYMTTVSLPAYDFRPEATAILGVAGVDIPLDYIKKLTMPHQTGVNGYAFILTNNGLLLLHPDHRKEFKNIIKPTFNRVDLTEAELVDDTNEPRDFNKSLLEMRDKIVRQLTGHDSFRVKIHIDNMRRVMLSRRHYFYTKIGPFSLVIALPDLYGFCKIRYETKNSSDFIQNSKQLTGLRHTKNWKVHPEWLYCKNYGLRRLQFHTPEKELLYFLNELEQNGWKWYQYCTPSLVTLLVLDAKATEWFEEKNTNWVAAMNKYEIPVAFLATHSGLTRWRSIYDHEPEFIKINNKAIDEVWYKRSVAYNYASPRTFMYSVPLDIELNNETLVTASNAIFRESGVRKSPVAVVGFQMNHYLLESIFKKTTSECGDKTCQHTCDSDELSCFVLDNNAYVVVSDEGYTGKFFGKVRPDIMKHLVENGLYRRTRFIDYQDICYLDPPSPKSKSPASKAALFLGNLFNIMNWFLSWLFYVIQEVFGAVVKDDPCTRAITNEYVKRAIHKSLPTPCDRQRWLYTLERDTYSATNDNMFTTPNCLWPYIVHPIPGSNLVLLVINKPCAMDVHVDFPYSPDPVVLTYNLSMPCYIATKNNYTRRQYIKCINSHKRENSLNLDHHYCGITWN